MARCPKCRKEIDSLSYNSKVAVTQIFSVIDGKVDYTSFDELGDHSDEVYKCTECYETLATNEEEAEKFLKGE